jgi:hypothetical protein
MNVEIGAEAAQLPEKEYINGIFVAVKQFKSSKVIVNLDIKKEFMSGENGPRSSVNCVDHKSCLILSVISVRIYTVYVALRLE